MTYQEILAAVPRLSRRELEGVRRACAASLALLGGAGQDKSEDWILGGILAELASRGLPVRPDFTIKNAAAYKGYMGRSVVVREHIEALVPDFTLNERRALGEAAAHSLARYITWKTISLDVLLERVDLVPQAIEKSFPGYMASGLLGVVIRHEPNQVPDEESDL